MEFREGAFLGCDCSQITFLFAIAYCFVDGYNWEYCDIPNCEEDESENSTQILPKFFGYPLQDNCGSKSLNQQDYR